MEACPYCGSNDLNPVEMDDCYACDLMECETCGEQFMRDEITGVDHTDDCPSVNGTSPEERCEACVAEAFAITSASDSHTCALRLPPDSTPAGLRVEIHEGIGSVTTCKVWRDGVLVFDGVDRSVLLSTPPAQGGVHRG